MDLDDFIRSPTEADAAKVEVVKAKAARYGLGLVVATRHGGSGHPVTCTMRARAATIPHEPSPDAILICPECQAHLP